MRMRVLASFLVVGLGACVARQEAHPPAQLLGNPVLDARTALAGGDSSFLGLVESDLELPGLKGSSVRPSDERSVRAFSARSLGLSTSGWEAQRDSLRVYAAAYNQLILEARESH